MTNDQPDDPRGTTPEELSEMTSDDLQESIEAGVSPHLLAMTAPTFALTVEALTYEYGEMAQVSKDAMERDSEDRPDYWKGRLDAYATVRGDLISALMRHDKVDDWPFTAEEWQSMTGDDDAE